MATPTPENFLELMAEKFQMLADATRLAILRTLLDGEKNVSEIVHATGHGQANISKHLRLLLGAGLVSRRKEGLNVFYKVHDPVVERICNLVCKTIAQNGRARGAIVRQFRRVK